MNTTGRAAIAQALSQKATRVLVYSSESAEDFRQQLLLNDKLDIEEPSLETQQFDQHIASVVEQTVALQNNVQPRPTVPAIFVVSQKALVDGQHSDQNLIREAVKAKIDNADAKVAMVLVPSEDQTEDDSNAQAITEAAKQFVGELEIPVLGSMEALSQFLAN